MDSTGGGCCIARYNNGGGYAYDTSKVNRILLKYRPIAPKPAASDLTLKISAQESTVKCGNKRRKNVQNDIVKKDTKNIRSGNKKRKVAPAVVTLQLLPESPDKKESPESGGFEVVQGVPSWLKFDEKNTTNNKNIDNFDGCHVMSHVPGGVRSFVKRVVWSCVKVESLAYTWIADLNGLGCTDHEKVMSLGDDTCPGFVSDGANRVVWVNGAYKEMFGSGDEAVEEEGVWLGLRDGIELGGLKCGGFTCQVRVVTWGEGNGKNMASMILPCDVWRMEFGGFAWRLDTKAALSLGR